MLGPSILGSYIGIVAELARASLLCLTNTPADALHLTRVFGCGCIGGAAFHLHGLLKAMEGRPALPSLKSLAMGGSKLPLPVLREARQKLTPLLMFGYGTTEAGLLSWATGEALEREEGSSGYLVPGVEMEAVDRDHRPLPPGDTGIIRVRTEEMAEYLNPTADTVEMFRDGWFYPGDVGSIDDKGLVVLEGRTTEVINHGGTIVAPELIEEVLRTLPAVKDVAVFGVVNSRGFEEIWAAVISDAPVDGAGLVAASRARLADKVPDRVVRVDDIPRGEMGKIRRRELRERVLAQLAAR
jgi:acyl-CoA synthetase (AMP-forming)/AMP-acid ligase II